MKILQINSVCGYGSTGRIVTDLYDILEENGNECWIAYGRGNAPQKYKTIKIGEQHNIYTNVIKARIFDSEGFNAKKETIEFIKKIEVLKPEIVHLHNLHGYYLNIEILFNYLNTVNIPVFWTLHDCWPFSPHSAYIDYMKDGSLPHKSNREDLKEYPKSILKNNSSYNYIKKEKIFTSLKNLTIICPSFWLAEMVKNSFLNIYDIKIINNGIDLNQFTPTESNFREIYSLKHKKIILGVASVWEERKGLKFFNNLADDLNSSYKIMLVGINKSDQKKVNSKILALDKTNNVEELAKLYTASNVFLNPTLEDNFPTTNIESIACGTPVITFETGGSPESIVAGTGLVVKKDNYNDLLKTIQKFDFNKDYRNACIEQSKKFDKNKIYKEYLQIYNTLNVN
ncbi:MAG: putative colanic acid biosynthesis glycosyltransferase [Carnobacterium sp.]|uniref:glycosyltransferase n=1 Tax=Carnobacterium sp. TaxID=48221 RepID=UPI0026472145|nr:glycosyltransferase [Carnobacterium sp.]MDN5372925.1 putative colanic acid biosynthesis glycosyltransferase [Carnobacterium sp.]